MHLLQAPSRKPQPTSVPVAVLSKLVQQTIEVCLVNATCRCQHTFKPRNGMPVASLYQCAFRRVCMCVCGIFTMTENSWQEHPRGSQLHHHVVSNKELLRLFKEVDSHAHVETRQNRKKSQQENVWNISSFTEKHSSKGHECILFAQQNISR